MASFVRVTLRALLLLLLGFLGLTALGGGVALMAGFGTPPVSMLANSPFPDFFIPGLALAVLVGGGGLLAAILVLRRHPRGLQAAGLAAVMIIVFEVVEVMSIGSPEGPAQMMQIIYVAVGLAIAVITNAVWTLERMDAVAKAIRKSL